MVEIAGTLPHANRVPASQQPSGHSQTMWTLAGKALRKLPAENAQKLTVFLLRADRAISDIRFEFNGNARSFFLRPEPDDSGLSVSAFGLSFPNPIGMAAGYDKDAKVRDAIFGLGFGFAECGTVTPLPQPGNEGQRIFRLLEDRAVINRMGFNSQGIQAISQRLRRRHRLGVIGINLGANKQSSDRISDYISMLPKVVGVADYVTVNVSSPNTPGLRGLQDQDNLVRLLSELTSARSKLGANTPLLLKIAPDLDNRALDEIAVAALNSGIDGLIVSNTTLSRPSGLASANSVQSGGLSGPPLFTLSTNVLREMYKRVGHSLKLVGVGGVSNGSDAYAKIRAGASLVQLYTALAYEGPGLVTRIKRELLECLLRDGYSKISDAVGADAV